MQPSNQGAQGQSLPKRQRPRFWDGKTVHFANKGIAGLFERRNFELGMTEQTSRDLALALMRLKQTGGAISLPDSVQEIVDALNYVLVGDPASTAAHRALEAGKGMTPDGGYREPEAGPGHQVDDAGRPV